MITRIFLKVVDDSRRLKFKRDMNAQNPNLDDEVEESCVLVGHHATLFSHRVDYPVARRG
jgi:hypothetical protein